MLAHQCTYFGWLACVRDVFVQMVCVCIYAVNISLLCLCVSGCIHQCDKIINDDYSQLFMCLFICGALFMLCGVTRRYLCVCMYVQVQAFARPLRVTDCLICFSTVYITV